MSANTETADWCVSDGDVTICGVDEAEYARKSLGIRWCFHCRKRHEFWQVCYAPVGLSYYGTRAAIKGTGRECTDLFPGWSYQWDED